MTCEPTQTPHDIDIPALREKYRQERDRRLRKDGQQQYLQTRADFADSYEHDPHTPVLPRAPISEDIDVAILGAGWSGLLTAYHLKQRGVSTFRNIDLAGDFGGCWYWNRYPGIQCDNDAYCYIPLLEETGYMPSKKFADGTEIYQHFQRIAAQFGLRDGALFHTMVRAMRWDEAIQRWRLHTNRGDDIRARFVVMAGGPLNRPKLPGVPGIESFRGHAFHTARWDYAYTGGDPKHPVLDKLADKRVAIVGTGASAIQIVPYLGKYAKQVYVVQRTPSSVDARANTPTNPEWVKTLEPGWQRERQINFHHGAMQGLAPGEPDLICDFWTELNRNMQAKLAARGWPQLTLEQYLELRETEDYGVMEKLRKRVEALVQDPATAEALKPYYRFLCKRPCSSETYYDTFNRPNVKLLDVSATRGLERMTETGIVANGVEYAVDCVIFASGFEVSSELSRRWGIETIEGKGGLSIYDHWADGYRTLHGMTTHGFPNFFFIGFTQGGLAANITANFDLQALHISHIVAETMRRGGTFVECSQKAQDEWVKTIRATAMDTTAFQRECTPSYFNNEGEDKIRWYLGEPYGPGFYAFEDLIRQWRDKGDMEVLVVK
ncbi:MAG TPA: NAD(P)/FAD-dependent oxidoreductase [Polyangiales bacterium]|nr:NAD(P)/FAD-dependent oxidoreductase [Polyangiales bacterium]